MRFVLAISALVLSGIMLVLGIGQVTFLAGPHQVSYTEQFDTPNGLAVIDAEQFDAVSGQANLVLQGEGAVIAIGHSRDVQAWVAPFAHAEVQTNAKDRSLDFQSVAEDTAAAKEYAELIEAEPGKKIVAPTPFGSDLWLEQRGEDPTSSESATGSQSVRLPVSLEAGETALVSVAEPSSAARLSIEWVQDRRTPWAGPLLVGGGALALIGALLYLLAVDHDRRGLGPRRGRKGPLQGIRNVFSPSAKRRAAKTPDTSSETAAEQTIGEKKNSRNALSRRAIAPVLVITAGLALSGCSPSYWPDFSAPEEAPAATTGPENTAAPVPVAAAQISRIVSDIAAVAGKSDDALDVAGLETRFTGDAFAERKANYTIRKAVSDYEVVVPRITSEELGYQLVQSTESWPRTVFVVVASEAEETAPAEGDTAAPATDGSPSLALIMTQQSPHENFLVSRTIALRGGITMPEAAPAEEGTALLADDLQTLRLAPAEVGAAYAAVLAGGTGVEQAKEFNLEGDSLIERSGAAWVSQSAQAAAAGGSGINYSVAAAQSDADIVSLSTGVGGAFVTNTVLETRTEAPAEGSRWRPTVPKSLTALSGLEGQQEKLVSVVAHQLLFFVPSKDSKEKIQLLGYTSDLVSASNS